MSEIATVERGLTTTEVVRVLRSKKFGLRLAELALYTATKSAEGGLAVYKRPATGKVTISMPELPSDDDRIKRLAEIKDRTAGIGSSFDLMFVDEESERKSYDPSLVYRRDGYTLRSDMGLFIHSHPNTREDHLRPSPADLNFDEYLSGRNPRLVSGILAPFTDRGSANRLLIYRTPSDGEYIQFYQGMEEHELPDDGHKMRTMLTDSGYNLAIVNYDEAGRLLSDPEEAAALVTA